MKPLLVEDAGKYTRGDQYWPEVRYDFTTGDLDYLGKNAQAGASTADEDWVIWKYNWSSSLPTRIQGPLTGSWDNRATLGW